MSHDVAVAKHGRHWTRAVDDPVDREPDVDNAVALGTDHAVAVAKHGRHWTREVDDPVDREPDVDNAVALGTDHDVAVAKHGRHWTRAVDDPVDRKPDVDNAVALGTDQFKTIDRPQDDSDLDGGGPSSVFQHVVDGGVPTSFPDGGEQND